VIVSLAQMFSLSSGSLLQLIHWRLECGRKITSAQMVSAGPSFSVTLVFIQTYKCLPGRDTPVHVSSCCTFKCKAMD